MYSCPANQSKWFLEMFSEKFEEISGTRALKTRGKKVFLFKFPRDFNISALEGVKLQLKPENSKSNNQEIRQDKKLFELSFQKDVSCDRTLLPLVYDATIGGVALGGVFDGTVCVHQSMPHVLVEGEFHESAEDVDKVGPYV